MVRAHMHDLKIPGVSLAVIRNGTIIKAAGYGLANVELNSPVTPQSVFTTCSIAKQFVAVGVMMLVEQGKVALDDSVTKYLPNSPPAWKEITVRHLLTHTSGVPDYAFGPTPWVDLRHDYTEDEVVRILARQPLDFRPGERRSYSNSGYVILGALIHEVSGKRWDESLQERIFRPLGMTSTRLMSEADIIPNDFLGIRCSRSSGKNTPLSVAILDPPAEFSSRAEAHCQLRKSCVFGIPSALGPRSISPLEYPNGP